MSEVTMSELQKMTKKYGTTTSGTKKQVASRLRQISAHTMTLADLKKVEDFLKLPQSKRYKGGRIYVKIKGRKIVRIQAR
jgi:hypothetical protein